MQTRWAKILHWDHPEAANLVESKGKLENITQCKTDNYGTRKDLTNRKKVVSKKMLGRFNQSKNTSGLSKEGWVELIKAKTPLVVSKEG